MLVLDGKSTNDLLQIHLYYSNNKKETSLFYYSNDGRKFLSRFQVYSLSNKYTMAILHRDQ